MFSDIAYQSINNGMECPSSLASQLYDLPYGDADSPNGYITFNSEFNWNCNFSEGMASEYNLPTMMLRGIARCLGFGASIVETGIDMYSYYTGKPTSFDALLYSSSTRMYELENESSELAKFVTSDDVFLDTEDKTYKIYTPKFFEQDRSLCCIEDTGSIMSSELGTGNVSLTIDDSIINILRTIGWNFPNTKLNIKCNDIANNGIGSSYISHTFYLDNNEDIVTDYIWKFYLKDKLGVYTLISTSSSPEFTIGNISSPQDYYININGDIEGKIECNYITNSDERAADPFYVSLELKPTIISIDNISKNTINYKFSLDFTVCYVGADNISIEVEEEYSSLLQDYFFNEPFLAHIHTGYISSLYYSWVTVIATNKYGEAYETIEFEPDYSQTKQSKNITKTEFMNINTTQVPTSVQLFKTDGTLVIDTDYASFTNTYIKPGLYIQKELFIDGSSITSKFIKR